MSLTHRQAVVLRATEQPLGADRRPAANRRYRDPRLSLERRSLPLLAPHDLRVEMLYVGICGTDLDLVSQDSSSRYVLTSAPAEIPALGRVIGHEGVGRVTAVGQGVDAFSVGDIVSFASLHACGCCATCRGGSPNHCPGARLLGTQTDGLFATVADVSAALAVRVSSMATDDGGLRAAACLEPAGCALLACDRAQLQASDRVLVLGGGPIGFYVALAARLIHGVRKVIVVEPLPVRRKAVAPWCDEVVEPDDVGAVVEEGLNVVIECCGTLEAVNDVLPRMAPDGRVVLMGRGGVPLILDAVDHLVTNGISVRGARGHLGGYLGKAMAMHQEGSFPLLAPVTGVLNSLSDLLDVLNDPRSLVANQCKVLVRI